MRSIPEYYYSQEWIRLRTKVLKRDNYKCAYCGAKANQADHVIPRGHGGPDKESNLVAACSDCNFTAGGRVFKSFKDKKRYITEVRRAQLRPKGNWLLRLIGIGR